MPFSMDIDDGAYDFERSKREAGVGRDVKDPITYLLHAATMWDLAGSDKGERLRRMMREEIDPAPGETETYLAPSQLARLVALLEGLEAALDPFLDPETWRLRPGALQAVLARAPELATARGSVEAICVLGNRISEVTYLRSFLETARRLGCNVIYE